MGQAAGCSPADGAGPQAAVSNAWSVDATVATATSQDLIVVCGVKHVQVDDQHLPDTATDATKVIQAWLLTLLRRHPGLDAAAAAAPAGLGAGPGFSDGSSSMDFLQQQHVQEATGSPLHLDVHITGHSLGGLLAEVATVESAGFAARHGVEWSCTSFESPGLPDL